MNKPIYKGIPLAENEFLFKEKDGVGFLTKLTQKGQLPKAFDEWRVYGWPPSEKLPIHVHTEVAQAGWKLVRWRIGKSQEWATMRHPEGFTVEIYLTNFLEIALNNVVDNGVILGNFKWRDHKLVKY